MNNYNVSKTIDMNEIAGQSNINPPHIFSLDYANQQLAVALGNGSVLVYKANDLRAPLHHIEAHMSRCLHVKLVPGGVLSVGERDIAVWKGDKLSRRVELENKVNWIEGWPKVYIADLTNEIITLTFPS